MTEGNIYMCILLMSITTYLIRSLPMTLIRGEIKNKFMKSFFYYVPYATIASMVLPDALKSTSSVVSALVGILIAIYCAHKEKDLIVLTLFAVIGVYITECFI